MYARAHLKFIMTKLDREFWFSFPNEQDMKQLSFDVCHRIVMFLGTGFYVSDPEE